MKVFILTEASDTSNHWNQEDLNNSNLVASSSLFILSALETAGKLTGVVMQLAPISCYF